MCGVSNKQLSCAAKPKITITANAENNLKCVKKNESRLALPKTPESRSEIAAAIRQYLELVVKKMNKDASTNTKGQTETSSAVDDSSDNVEVSYTITFNCGTAGASRFLQDKKNLTKNLSVTSNLVSEP